MAIKVKAVYEDGVLKPAEPLPLKEHERSAPLWGQSVPRSGSGSPPVRRRPLRKRRSNVRGQFHPRLLVILTESLFRFATPAVG